MKWLCVSAIGILVAVNANAVGTYKPDKKLNFIGEVVDCSLLNSYAENYDESKRLRVLALEKLKEITPSHTSDILDEYRNVEFEYKNNNAFWTGYLFAIMLHQRKEVIEKTLTELAQNNSQQVTARNIAEGKNCSYLK